MHLPLLHIINAFKNFCIKFIQAGDTQKLYTPIKYLKIIERKKEKIKYSNKINLPAITDNIIENNKAFNILDNTDLYTALDINEQTDAKKNTSHKHHKKSLHKNNKKSIRH